MKPRSKVNKPKKSIPSGYQAPAVGRAFQILKRVAESRDEFGLSEIAHELGYSKSTTHGLIQALLNAEALDYDGDRKKFILGPAIMDLAFGNWNYIRARELAQPHLDELRDRIGETVLLGGLSRHRGIIIAVSESTRPLKISAPPGTTLPILAGAVGKIYLSRFKDEDAAQIIRQHGLKKYTPASIIDETAYLRELARVRKQKYALDTEEYLPGINAVAISLGNKAGLPLAIWVVGFAGSMKSGNTPKIVTDMLVTAEKIRKSINGKS